MNHGKSATRPRIAPARAAWLLAVVFHPPPGREAYPPARVVSVPLESVHSLMLSCPPFRRTNPTKPHPSRHLATSRHGAHPGARRPAADCPECGYSRGHAAVCPECGAKDLCDIDPIRHGLKAGFDPVTWTRSTSHSRHDPESHG